MSQSCLMRLDKFETQGGSGSGVKLRGSAGFSEKLRPVKGLERAGAGPSRPGRHNPLRDFVSADFISARAYSRGWTRTR